MFLVKQNDLTLDARSDHKQKNRPSRIHIFNLFNENCGKLSYHSHSDYFIDEYKFIFARDPYILSIIYSLYDH